jgi:hypothetical protein
MQAVFERKGGQTAAAFVRKGGHNRARRRNLIRVSDAKAPSIFCTKKRFNADMGSSFNNIA